jgi:hypothetical protein
MVSVLREIKIRHPGNRVWSDEDARNVGTRNAFSGVPRLVLSNNDNGCVVAFIQGTLIMFKISTYESMFKSSLCRTR